MDKISIADLSAELNVEPAEMIKVLNENGIEAKAKTKKLDEEQVKLVKSKMETLEENNVEPILKG